MSHRYVSCVAGDGAVNEDIAELGSTWAFVLDGATAPPLDNGCRHGVRWYVDRLAEQMVDRLRRGELAPLADLLADSIKAVTAGHAGTCDVTNPSSPTSTVGMVRERDGQLDYLVLADSPVILDVAGEIRPVLDERIDHLPAYDLDTVTRVRNTDGGFWVAGTDPAAAHQAVTGSVPLADVRRVVLATDGATRLVDVFGVLDWPGLVDICTGPAGGGPRELIARTRRIEAEPDVPILPRARRKKGSDDATVIAIRY